MLQELNPHIRYVVPEEGTNIWVGSLGRGDPSDETPGGARISWIYQRTRECREERHIRTPRLTEMAANKLLRLAISKILSSIPVGDSATWSAEHKVLPPRVMRKWNTIFAEVVN